MNKQIVYFMKSILVAVVLMVSVQLMACVTATVKPPQITLSLPEGEKPLVQARLGEVRVEGFTKDALDAATCFDFFAFRMDSIVAGYRDRLRTTLITSGLFGDSSKDVINVRAELLSVANASPKSWHVKATVKYEFRTGDGNLLLAEEITADMKDSYRFFDTDVENAAATMLYNNIVEFAQVIPGKLGNVWDAYAQKREAIYRRIAAELGKEDRYYRVVATQTVVRKMPDADAMAVSKLSQEELVHVTGSLPSGWLQVGREGKPIGWVHSSLLREDFASSPSYRPVDAQKVTLAPVPTHQADVTVEALDFGTYHALVIGNNEYHDIRKLHTAVSDARAIAALLQDKYGFKTRLVLNATRADIMRAINEYRRRLGWRDNLLIYYAGHGWLDQDADQGYWLPVDATEQDPTNWISNGTITDALRAMDAKHILVIADSCYSGKLARGINVRIRTKNYYKKISRKKARTVMASGGLEPVADEGGKGTHSVFASALIEALNENQGVLDATLLFSQIRRPVMVNTDQTPEYSDIRKAGHDGGDFLFVKQKR